MGGGIHAHYERCWITYGGEAGGYWVDKGDAEIDRDYDLFALLAGVRNRRNLTPIAPPKGLPDDVSESVRAYADFFGEDGHNHSWLTLREFEQSIVYAIEVLDDYSVDRFITILHGLRDLRAVGLRDDDIRLVFWFDS